MILKIYLSPKMGKSDDLIEAARLGNYPACERLLSAKPKKAGPFAR